MVGYLIAEWREWETGRLRPSAVAFAAAGLLGLAYTYLQPFLAAWATSAACVLCGWISSNRFRPGYCQRRILLASGLGPLALVGARCATELAAFSLCALALSPALALVARAWDIGAPALAAALCAWFGAYLLASSAAYASGLLFGRSEHPVGIYALAGWLILPAFLPPLRSLDPFSRTWAALGRGEALACLGCAAREIGLALLALLGASLAFRRREGRGRG